MKATISIIFFSVFITVHSQDYTLKLWPDDPPGAVKAEDYVEIWDTLDDGRIRISQVTDPTIEVFLPDQAAPASRSGVPAVVICPGGGYGRLAMTHEGWEVARWLNENGIAGIVLKYRLPSREIMADQSIGPLQDAQEAIRIVRRNAGKWGIDPEKIGIMGFSAGGHLASTASTHYGESVYDADETNARPDFSILIYPVINMGNMNTHYGSRRNLLGNDLSTEQIERFSNDQQVDADTPPAFLVHSWDDRTVVPQNSIAYAEALSANKVPVELHLYEKGGHGYGLGRGKGTQNNWPGACIAWLENRGIIH
jgi:acetyl esterase/lipase